MLRQSKSKYSLLFIYLTGMWLKCPTCVTVSHDITQKNGTVKFNRN